MFNVHFFSLSFFSFPFFAALMPATPPKVYTPHTKKCSYNSNSYQWDSDRSKEPSGSHHSTSHCSSCTSNYSHHSTSVPTDAPTSLRKCGFLQASLSSAPLPSGLQASRQPFQNSACQFCPKRKDQLSCRSHRMYVWLGKYSCNDLFYASHTLVKCPASCALGLGISETPNPTKPRRKTSSCFYEKLVCVNVY